MKFLLFFTILKAQLVCHYAQFIINGDTQIFTRMKKSNVLEEEAKQKADAEALEAANAAEEETVTMIAEEIVRAYTERGSLTLPGGEIIEANINVDEQIIDPRTPKSFGNPLVRQLEANTAAMSVAEEEAGKDFWYTTIPITMGGDMYTLPVGEEQFMARLKRFYQALFNLNMEEIVTEYSGGHYEPYCNDTSMHSYEQLYEPSCLAPCQCDWYSSTAWRTRCEISCADGDIIGLFECRWATGARDSIVPLVKASNYANHQTACGLQIDLAYSKKLIQGEQKVVEATPEHPMDMDLGMSMGVF